MRKSVRLSPSSAGVDVQVSSGHVARLLERLQTRDNLVEADVGVEGGLGLGKEHDRAVGTSAAVYAVRPDSAKSSVKHVPELSGRLESGRERDGVVEREAESLVGLVSALVEEQVVLELVADGEEVAARRVGSGVDAVRAGDTPGECA